MIKDLILPPESNLSVAWAKAFLEMMKPGSSKRIPAVIQVSNISPENIENIQIREALDTVLLSKGLKSCQTVASTIFPSSMWNPNLENSAESLFARYDAAWPGIKKCTANKNGVYFRRLTAYAAKGMEGTPVNQLKKIIDTYNNKNNHRVSALQASIFDPTRDHSDQPQRGFPCLQQVGFALLDNNQLAITGFYAKQLHIEKAYGNYLGLYELGKFVASQLNRTLTQVTCVANCLQLTELNKTELHELKSTIENYLAETQVV